MDALKIYPLIANDGDALGERALPAAAASTLPHPSSDDWYALAAEALSEFGRFDFSELEYAVLLRVLLKSFFRCRAKAIFPRQRDLCPITGLDEPKLSRVLERLKTARVLEEKPRTEYSVLPSSSWRVGAGTAERLREEGRIGVRFEWSAAAMASDLWLDLDLAERDLFPEPPGLTEALRALSISSRPVLCRTGDSSGPGVIPAVSRGASVVPHRGPLGTEPATAGSVFPVEARIGPAGQIGPIVRMPSHGVDIAPGDLAEKASDLPKRQDLAEKATPSSFKDSEFKAVPNLSTPESFKERGPLAHSASSPGSARRNWPATQPEAAAFLARGIEPGLLNTLLERDGFALVELERLAGLPNPPRPLGCSEARERELLGLARVILGDKTMQKFGGYWRKRLWWKPAKLERVLRAVEEDERDATRRVTNAGGHARYLWYLFAE